MLQPCEVSTHCRISQRSYWWWNKSYTAQPWTGNSWQLNRIHTDQVVCRWHELLQGSTPNLQRGKCCLIFWVTEINQHFWKRKLFLPMTKMMVSIVAMTARCSDMVDFLLWGCTITCVWNVCTCENVKRYHGNVRTELHVIQDKCFAVVLHWVSPERIKYFQ